MFENICVFPQLIIRIAVFIFTIGFYWTVKVGAYFHDQFTSISWNLLQIFDSYYYSYKRQKYYSKIHPPFPLY